jgi:multicomponent Na+:H+ antiporter subunit D
MQQAPILLAAWLVILPVILPLLGGAALLMARRHGRFHLAIAGTVGLAVAIVDGALLWRVVATGPVSMTMGRWLPPFGISFTADATGALFALAGAVVTLVVLAYTAMDVEESRDGGAFPAMTLLLLAGVSGAFLTGDLFNLYVWFELILIASFGLLVFGGAPLALDGAVKYAVINFTATTLFLTALGLLYGALGTLNMADIFGAAPRASPAIMASVAALLATAFGIKAAAFPVNAWLPASYHTPAAAVSALLGGLLTKVGVYALLRTLMLLPASRDFLHPVIIAVAAATLVLAPLAATAETNLRRAIGYLLIGGIGSVVAGIAMPDALGTAGAVVYVVHAMLTISALYLVAGLVERRTGATDTRRMGGLYAASPTLSVLFLLLIAGIAGLPPFLGFWPKLLLLEAGAARSGLAGTATRPLDLGAAGLTICLLLNALLTLIAGARLWSHIFWRAGPEDDPSEHPARPLQAFAAREKWFGMGAVTSLAGIILLAGLWPNPLIEAGRAAAASLLDLRAYVAATGLAAPP